MNIFDWYVFKNLSLATVFIGLTLVVVVFLTQSLKFLELVMDSGASSVSFWILTLLALPRFFEVILPLALMAGILFVYNRMSTDSELSVVRSLGYSPMALARPALLLAVIVSIFLWSMTLWAAPKSLSQMQHMRQVIKAQFSALFLREGVFNKLGDGLTVYVRERSGNDALQGILIHDSRDEVAVPSTVIAKQGVVVGDNDGFEVVVYNGSRQTYDPQKKILQQLNFERYVVDLPDSAPVSQRWKEPDERTIFELLQPDMENERDAASLKEFHIEIQKRICSPFLAINLALVSCVVLLVGPVDRRGHARRIILGVGIALVLESLFLSASNMARNHPSGVILMYVVTIGPLIPGLFLLSSYSEGFRRRVFYQFAGHKPQAVERKAT